MTAHVVTGFVAPEPYPEVDREIMICENMGGVDTPLVVRLSSYDPAGEHALLESLRGKQVRITVEVIGE